jgi:hypothetical protein
MCGVRFGSKADICSAKWHVRFTAESGHWATSLRCLLCAKSGHRQPYSMTSSARASSAGGTVKAEDFGGLFSEKAAQQTCR